MDRDLLERLVEALETIALVYFQMNGCQHLPPHSALRRKEQAK